MEKETLITETIIKTKHRRSPTQMSFAYKKQLKEKGCHICSHDTDRFGDHTIVYREKKGGKIRVAKIEHQFKIGGRNRTLIANRPATKEERSKYTIK